MYRTQSRIVTSWIMTLVMTAGIAVGILDMSSHLRAPAVASSATTITSTTAVTPAATTPTATLTATRSTSISYRDDGVLYTVSGGQASQSHRDN